MLPKIASEDSVLRQEPVLLANGAAFEASEPPEELPRAMPSLSLASTPAPGAPRTLEDADLPFYFLVELIAKVLVIRGQSRLNDLVQHLRLPASVLENAITFMRAEKLCELMRRGAVDGDMTFQLTENGRLRASEYLQKNQYSGVAPVSLRAYSSQIERQSIGDMTVTRDDVALAFRDIIMTDHNRELFGPALNSGRAIFIYGPAGSGKTFLAETMVRLLKGVIAVPHALLVGGEVIQIFDPLVHHTIDHAHPSNGLERKNTADLRWEVCNRPVVAVGGELTLETLDLAFEPNTRFYQAPPQVKANNGILIIDDLGRQRVSAREIMNRWIVPLDRRKDYLALHTGHKFTMPFDVTVVFSSNMQPHELADESFFRRLGYKIYVGPLDAKDYRAVFQQTCEQLGISYNDEAFHYVLTELHYKTRRPLLACFPRDILGQIKDQSRYLREHPQLTPEVLKWAWHNYFTMRHDPAQQQGEQQ